jgi:hypothetical protein
MGSERKSSGGGGWIARVWRDPWGQMVIYLLIFIVLGYGVMALFTWVRGPQRPRYVPWDASQPASLEGR